MILSTQRFPSISLVMVLAIGFAACANAEERPHSRLAVPGPDGKLTYPSYSDRGDRLPDFSWCGYRGGGVVLPKLPVKVTLEPVAGDGDDQARIQKALDTVGELPLDEKGFRGAVLLKRGTYRAGGMLKFNKSGVVLRGEGDGEDGTVVIATARKKYGVIQISGSGAPKVFEDTKQQVLNDYVPVGSRTFKVKDASAYKVGDEVMVCREANQEWIDAIGMKEVNTWKPFTMTFFRVVMDVTKDTVTVDAPLVNPIDKQWGGGYLVRYEYPGRVENIGVEGIRCDSVYASPTDHAHAWKFVSILHAQNIWVRDCTAIHFAYTAVEITDSAKWVTVQDTKCLDMISVIKGGLRYPFASGSGHGWAGAQTVLWNCKASAINVQQPPTSQNFAIGCVADKKMGDGYWESKNVPVTPRSLYLQQLEERLGPDAVKNLKL